MGAPTGRRREHPPIASLSAPLPLAHVRRQLLLRAVAYRMQEEAYGGLSAKTRKQLARAARDLAAGRSLKAAAAKIKPGTRLLREWQGVVHEVVVVEDSVRY